MDKTILDWVITNIAILGFAAAMLGTVSLIPQVIKTWKSHSVKGISLIMYIIISVDSVLWLIYGSVLNLTPLIVQSSITFTCAFMMIIMKLLSNNIMSLSTKKGPLICTKKGPLISKIFSSQ